MDYRILGPLELRDGAAPLPLAGGRQRALLALLLIHRNEVVSSERLIDALWGERPPPSAAKALQNAVLQVRRALGDGASALSTEHRGYMLHVAADEVDADRFEALASAGRAALDAGDPAAAAEQLRAALALFERMRCAPWIERTESELKASGETLRARGADRAVDELTPQELQVATLAAAGLSNKEAAIRLYLSVKTIEAHLHRTYRKLGVRSRAELAPLLGKRDPGA
jgi:DNA-binding SARP family transcriptional activator